jgi:hypothetical protein
MYSNFGRKIFTQFRYVFFLRLAANGGVYETLGIAWLRTYPTLLTLPAGTKLANCTETAMFYNRVLN